MRLPNCLTALSLSLFTAFALSAQQSNSETMEVAFTAGTLSGSNPGATLGSLSLGNGVALEGNFAKKIRDLSWGGSLYWEVDGVINPFRNLSGTPTTATHDIWSIYVTPGVKLQFSPKEKISPWLAFGGGYAGYDSNKTSIGGTTSGVSGIVNRAAVDIGGGIDFAMGSRALLRFTSRGFYTGGPNFGTNTPGGQFNLVIGGGLVFRFPK